LPEAPKDLKEDLNILPGVPKDLKEDLNLLRKI